VIVDVAGGHGSLLAAILEAAPRARGVLVDLAHVTAVARRTLAERGLAGRAEVVTGSMFEAVPAGGDAYVLKWILHDWDDAACVTILGNIRAAIVPEGRLLVVDRVLPERATASAALRAAMMADLLMLVHLTGRERTEREFRALFDASGFGLERVIPTGTQLSVVEAAPR
jgi:predicted O-methyltransferase YrrM